MLFSTAFNNKVNLVAKIMPSAYLSVSFHVKHRTITIPSGFNLISAEMATIVGDVTGLQRRYHP